MPVIDFAAGADLLIYRLVVINAGNLINYLSNKIDSPTIQEKNSSIK